MRKAFLFILALVATSALAATALTREVLVLTTATAITRTANTTAIELQNLGPNPIFCALNDASVTTTSGRQVDASGGVWAVDASDALPVYCIASTAAQVSGAGTRVTELR